MPSRGTSTIQASAAASAPPATHSARGRPCLMSGAAGAVVACMCVLPHVARGARLPVGAVPQETYGPLGPIFAIDQPSSSTHTREALGWEPTHPSLLDDLECLQP